MRLVDKDSLEERCVTYINGDRYVAEWRIESEPEIEAVPVVRCKDCKNWNRHICTFDSPNGYCDAHEEMTNGYDYCSYGERKSYATD